LRCDMTAYYPINLKLEDRPCVVIGGGNVALRKVRSLLACGGRVKVISPELCPGLRSLAGEGEVQWLRRGYRAGDLEGAFLVIAATDDEEMNARVASEAKERGVLLNVVDDPERCGFIVPATVQRGDLVITVSTSGKSPMLARKIREELERRFGPEYGPYVDFLGRVRELVVRDVPAERRPAVFREIVYDRDDLFGLVEAGDEERALAEVRELIDRVVSVG